MAIAEAVCRLYPQCCAASSGAEWLLIVVVEWPNCNSLQEEAAASAPADLREQSKATDVSISSSGGSSGTSQESGSRSDGAPGRRRKEEPLEEKRVRNSLIKEELAVELVYPSYRQGLAAINAGDRWPFDDEQELRFALA